MFGTAEREEWKLKYRELLTELESKEKQWHALDETMRSVATRLAITAMGRDPAVDRLLDQILDSVRSGASNLVLRQQMENLSTTVVDHESSQAAAEDLDLSEFAASLKLAPDIRRRYVERLDGGPAGARSRVLRHLARELNQLIAGLDNESGTSDPTSIAASLTAGLLHHFGDIPGLAETVGALQRRIEDGVDEADSDELFRDLSSAISDVIASIESEKDELEAFLEQITAQLAEFEKWASWHEDDTRGRQHDSDELDKSVELQVHGMHQDIETSTELVDLKQRVQSRLDAVANHLRVFREQEQHRRNEVEKRSASLRNEINQLKVRTAELAQKVGEQESRLMLDTLTGVHTRYAYDQRLQEEFQRWQRHGQPLSYSIWDIDRFKAVNDNFGHQVGDRLLEIVAEMLSQQTRLEDFIARIGGEEFVVLFPATALEPAEALANRLRIQIAETDFRHKDAPIDITMSCGLTEFRQGDTPETVYERADKALYEAKNSGRNRCIAD